MVRRKGDRDGRRRSRRHGALVLSVHHRDRRAARTHDGGAAMSVIEHARSELKRINFGDDDSRVMIEIMEKLFDQWDSGGAVSVVVPVLHRLLHARPLTPLTGEDDEWMEVSDGVLQNVRCGSVFRENGKAHDIDAADPR